MVICINLLYENIGPQKSPRLSTPLQGEPFFLIPIVEGGVQMGLLGTSATNWPILHAPGDYDDGEYGGIVICRRNRSTLRKAAPVPLCPQQIPHYLTWARTQAATMGSQRLTAGAMARPKVSHSLFSSDERIFL
jgi:hypothetical protein